MYSELIGSKNDFFFKLKPITLPEYQTPSNIGKFTQCSKIFLEKYRPFSLPTKKYNPFGSFLENLKYH